MAVSIWRRCALIELSQQHRVLAKMSVSKSNIRLPRAPSSMHAFIRKDKCESEEGESHKPRSRRDESEARASDRCEMYAA
mmetsp:Transcript_74671/g.199981  ORF Transcript_74671/g.199981 Transcript_74671/m.199981 type:complete len:80 (-) Transcript_74671:270-509(-)